MDEQKLKNLIDQQIDSYMKAKQFSVSKIPNHTHNGTDSVQISESNILPSPTFGAFLVENVSETFFLTNLPETLTQLTFNGIAANNAADLSLPGTKKALCTGQAIFRNCFGFVGAGSEIPVGVGQSLSLIQTTSSMYIDEATLANTGVAVSGLHILYVIDETDTVVASLSVSSFNRGRLTIESHVESGWAIQGTLLLT